MAKRRRSSSSSSPAKGPSPSTSKPRASQLHQSPPQPQQQQHAHHLLHSLSPILFRLTSATQLSLAFLSHSSTLLHPSQTLSLESHLLSAASSLSSLLSLLSPSLPPPLPPHLPPPAGSWYLRFLASHSSDSPLDRRRWLETFRMSRPSFYLLLQTLSPSLHLGPPLPPPDHKLAAALLRLSHSAPYPSLSRLFALDGPLPACRAFFDVCRAVLDRMSHLLSIPDPPIPSPALPPGCRGALGYGRFAVGGGRSVIAQAVTDGDGRFLDVSAGWGGAMSPVEILPRTRIFASYAAEDAERSGYLLGESCCPLLPWLITPFGDGAGFDGVHSRAMEAVGKAFQGLRARWRLLGEGWKGECVEALPFVVVMGCLLHNFLLECGEPMPEDGVDVGDSRDVFGRFEGKVGEDGERVREDLALQLCSS